MAALGFTIVYNASKLINFANGEFLMIGGVVLAGAVALAGLPLWVAVPLAVAMSAAIGWVMQRVILENARHSDHLTLVMLTIGVALALRGAAALVFGRDISFVPEFGILPLILVGNVYVPSQGVWIVLTLAVLSLALWHLFSRTLFGKAMRAASQEPRAAALCGIEPRNVTLVAMVTAAAIGGLAGALMAPISAASYESGIFLGLKGFAAAVVGGLGNPLGAIVGGLLIGVIESLTAGYVASGFKDAIGFLVLILVLILRPQGLVGRAVITRV
jgi:branched-chain amino acid transport system permease protein